MPKEGMSKKEVEEHLKDLKTDAGRIGYLNSVLKKKSILAEGTQKVIHEMLGDLYVKGDDFEDARVEYRRADKTEKVEHAINLEEADHLIKSRNPDELEKAGKLFEKEEFFARATHAYELAGCNHLDVKKGAACYEKAAKTAEKEGDKAHAKFCLKKAVQRYEKAADKLEEEEKGVKARRIRRKIKKLGKEEGLEAKLPVVILIGVLGIGLYFLFSNVNITSNVVMNLSVINQGFLINFILTCILGLVCYSYLK